MNTLLLEHLAAVSKIAAYRQAREHQEGVDASKGYLQTTNAGLLFEGPRTLECYLKYMPHSETQFPFASSVYMMAIEFMPTNIALFYCGGKNIGARIVPNTDYHIIIAYDGTMATAYLNGNSVGSFLPESYSVASLFRVGHDRLSPLGPIYFCRHYNYALSAEEVVALYNNGDPAGYVLPNAMKELTPVKIVGNNSYTWTGEDDSTYAKTINLSQKLSEGRFYRFTITVSNYESGAPFFVANRGINTYIPAQNGTHIIDVIIDRSYDSLMYIYGGNAGTDRRLTLIVNSIEPVGCVAEYLPQNLVGSSYDDPVEIVSNNSYTWTGVDDSTNAFRGKLSRPSIPGQAYRIRYTISNYEAGRPTMYVCGAIVDNINTENGPKETIVVSKVASAGFDLYGGPLGSDRRLTFTLDSVEPIPGIASSWLDSAKQLPLNDEYLPPLLEPIVIGDARPVRITEDDSYTWAGTDGPYSYIIPISRVLTMGQTYKITVTISGYEAGAPMIYINNSDGVFLPKANGTHEVILKKRFEFDHAHIFIYGGLAGTDRRVTVKVDSIQPVVERSYDLTANGTPEIIYK